MNDTEAAWRYQGEPDAQGDARKLVTLLEGGMVWVGVRFWNFAERRWMNNNEPEQARVLAWMDLPEPARKRWVRGNLT